MMYFGIGAVVCALYMLFTMKSAPGILTEFYNENAEFQRIDYETFTTCFMVAFVITTVLLWPLCVAVEINHRITK